MNDIAQILFGYGMTGGFYAAIMLGALVWFAAIAVVPKPLVMLIVCVTAAFPKTSTSVASVAFGFDVYTKGGGYFFFSILEITLLLLAVTAALRRAGGDNPLSKYYWMMCVVLLWHITITMIDTDQSWLTNLSRSGILYLLLQGLFVAALTSYIATAEDLRKLMWLLAMTIAIRMLWGGFRYALLGGDPMNYDDPLDGSANLRMTFWDINDSIFACLLGSLLLWIAMTADQRPRWQRVTVLAFGLYCFAIVALTARRTAQGGALLALATLFLLLPKGRRWPVLLIVTLSIPVVVYKLQERMGTQGSLFEHLTQQKERASFYVDPRYNRFYELRTAWRTIEEHPLIGVGPAGEFEVTDDTGLMYHRGNYGFVHSGFGHILLKTGTIGLLIFCALLVSYLRALARAWPGASAAERGVLAASVCGFAASVPNLVVGTPLIEARTMLVMGLLMALPLLVASTRREAAGETVPAPLPNARGTAAAIQ